MGRYSDAVRYLQIAIDKDADNLSAHIALARTYDLLQQTEKAENIYVELIQKAPKNWEVFQGYGYFLARHGRYSEAVDTYHRVLELTPENLVAINNLGGTLLFLGDFNKAIPHFESSLRISSNSTAFSNLGTAYYYLGKFDKAVFYYKKAIELSPLELGNLNDIADAYHFIHSMESISDDYRKQVKLYAQKEIVENPANVLGHLYFAIACAHLGQLSEAKMALAKAGEIDPNHYFYDYVALRVAVAEKNYDQIVTGIKKLKLSGYSDKLIISDPYFKLIVDDDYLYGALKTEVNLNK